jgi:hypothetical protein
MLAVKWYDTKGDVASRLRQRKYALLRGLHIPPDALPGSLALTHRRCGTPTCWCAKGGDGHPMWSLTFMANGKRRVEWIPNEWVEEIRPLVEQGREFKEATAEVFAANAQLLALWRRQSRKKEHKKKT